MEPIKIVKLKEEYENAFAVPEERAVTTLVVFPFRILNILVDTSQVLVGGLQHGLMSMKRKEEKKAQGTQVKGPARNIEIKQGKDNDLLN
ncbi:MAG: hypothetical protein HGB11_03750 [Chlorobiales bacterium]|jgi:hypothetical protein|nr:hypothetical protein [Chlorobiales bacterium]